MELYLKIAKNLIASGEYKKAIETLDMALESDPSHELVLEYKGFALINLEEYEEVLSVYDTILKINPINERALEYKALALTKLGGYIDALEICEQLLKIRPNDEIYLNKKACLLSMVNRNQESITLCDEILKIYPENTDAQATKNSVLNHIKKLQELTEYANENREVFFPASIQKTNNQKNNDFTEFKKLGSNDIALYWKAIKLGNDNKYQEALEIFNKILVTNPDNTEVKNCRDIVLKKLGKKELF